VIQHTAGADGLSRRTRSLHEARSSRFRRRTTTSASSTTGREWARTDFGQQRAAAPRVEELMREARRRADAAGHLRFALPKEFGGKDGSNLWMTVIREHLAAKGLGLHYDQQTDTPSSPTTRSCDVPRFRLTGSEAEFIEGSLNGTRLITFGLTEPQHGSDATHMETRAVRETRNGVSGWRINGEKM